MPVDLSGPNSIINAYLKGVALRQDKEQQQMQFEIAQQREESRQEQLKQAQAQFTARLNETTNYHRAQTEAREKTFQLQMKEFGYRIAQGLQDKSIELAPDTALGFRYTQPGTKSAQDIANKIAEIDATANPEAKKQVTVQTALAPVKAETARQVSMAELPARSNLQMSQQLFQKAMQEDRQVFDAVQQQKRLDAAWARANLANERISTAKKEEKDALVQESVASLLPLVQEGSMTLEDINKNTSGTAETKLRISNEIRKQAKFLHDPDREALKALPMAQTFLEKLHRLRDIINNTPDPRLAHLRTDYGTLKKEINQDLDAWGRAVKGFKGQVTEKDTGRLEGGIPSPTPAGVRSFNADEIRKANIRRVESVESFIQEKFNLITHGMTPQQKETVRKTFGIMDPPVRKSKQAELKKKQKTNGKINPEIHEAIQ